VKSPKSPESPFPAETVSIEATAGTSTNRIA
jgi:hypothetical protein